MALALLEAGATFTVRRADNNRWDEIVIELTATFHVHYKSALRSLSQPSGLFEWPWRLSATRVAVPIKERRSVSDRRSGADVAGYVWRPGRDRTPERRASNGSRERHR